MAKRIVAELMSETLSVCVPATTIENVAQMMAQQDCGEIPVVESLGHKVPVGVVTDRDIVCRLVARGKDPLNVRADECMSQPVVVVRADDSVDEAVSVMQRHQIRRVPVVDPDGVCVGMLAQADVARQAEEKVTKLLREVSRDTGTESR